VATPSLSCGELDLAGAAGGAAAAARGPDIVVDLVALELIGSSGLAALARRAEAGPACWA
jgi:anti-anti-sigma regulatory factor